MDFLEFLYVFWWVFKGDRGEIKRENEFDEVAMAFWCFKINVNNMVLIYGDM